MASKSFRSGLFVAAAALMLWRQADCDNLQLPSLHEGGPNLLIPLSVAPRHFFLGGVERADVLINTVFGTVFESTERILVQSGASRAFLSFDNIATVLGPRSHANLNQYLSLDVSSEHSKSYGTKIFLSVAALDLVSAHSGQPVLQIKVNRQNFHHPGELYTETFTLRAGEHVVSAVSGTGLIRQDPSAGYFRKWDDQGHVSYTLAFQLDPAYTHWPIRDIQLVYQDPLPNGTVTRPSLLLRGLNIETAVHLTPPEVTFKQVDGQWGDLLMNNQAGKKVSIYGCVLTSAAMAMRSIGIDRAPDGSLVTPASLLAWLNGNQGFSGKTALLLWDALVSFSNAAAENGYNGGKSILIYKYRIRDWAALTEGRKRAYVENELASRNPILMRVAHRSRTVDNEGNRNAHTVMAFGLLPNYDRNVAGTYQMSDPGGLTFTQDNLWDRKTGREDWKGKWLYGVSFRKFDGVFTLPNITTLVLHSPGKIYVEGSQSGFKAGFSSATGGFVNSFPNATYEYLDPNENHNPGDAEAPAPPPEEPVQVLRIYNRPSENLQVKVVGTGTGAYTLTIDEKVWQGARHSLVHSEVKQGHLTPTTVINASVPAHGTATPAVPDAGFIPASTQQAPQPPAQTTALGPKVDWEGQEERLCSWGRCNNWVTVVSGSGDVLPGQAVVPLLAGGTVSLRFRLESRSGCAISDLEGQLKLGSDLRGWQYGSAESATVQYFSILLHNAGRWKGRLRAFDVCGHETFVDVTIDVGKHVAITSHPVPRTVAEGGGVELSVVATGDPQPWSYQWFKDGQSIPGASGSTFALASAQPADFGQYYCRVRQYSDGQVMSEAASNVVQLDVIPGGNPVLGRLSSIRPIRNGKLTIHGANFGYDRDRVEIVLRGPDGNDLVVRPVSARGTSLELIVPKDAKLGPSTLRVSAFGKAAAGSLDCRVIPNLNPILQGLLLQ